MPLDAMVLTALRRELSNTLIGGKIDRISMPEKDMLILFVRTREAGTKKLLISVRPGAARIHLTGMSLENLPQPPMFCMLLRKYLLGGRITALEQPEGERLIRLDVDAVDELGRRGDMALVLELMGKGLNLVLVDGDGRILDCLRRVDYEDSRRRALLPGLFYSLPPAQDKPSFFRTDPEACSAMIRAADKKEEADRWLLRTFSGLSPFLCRELARDGWDGLEANLDALLAVLSGEAFVPVMLLRDGKPFDYSFLPVRQYGETGENRAYPDFGSLLDDFYSARDRQENLRRRSAELTRTARTARDRLRRKLAAREQELFATENRDEYRRRGDLITANIYRLRRGMDSFETQDFYDPELPVITIPLDVRKTPQQNAAANYKLYNKAKTARRILTELIATAKEEEAYLDSVLDELARAETDRDLTEIRSELTDTGYIRAKGSGKKIRKPSPGKPMRFVSDSGTEILVGRSNVQNDELTFHTARRGNLWLHVQKVPGSHVIVSCENGVTDERTLSQAASLAVTYSQAAEGGKCAVDCTAVRNVRKPAGAKPGRVIYTDQRTLVAQADPELARRLRRD